MSRQFESGLVLQTNNHPMRKPRRVVSFQPNFIIRYSGHTAWVESRVGREEVRREQKVQSGTTADLTRNLTVHSRDGDLLRASSGQTYRRVQGPRGGDRAGRARTRSTS